jgi:hypothetical protein
MQPASTVMGAHLVHAAEIQDHFAGVLVHGSAAAQAGVAALGHDGDVGRRAQLHDLSHLGGGAGTQHQRRLAVIEPAFLMQVGRHGRRLGDAGSGADDIGQTVAEGLIERQGRTNTYIRVTVLKWRNQRRSAINRLFYKFNALVPRRASGGR